MIIRGLTPGQFDHVINVVSVGRYGGNVIPAGPWSVLNQKGTRFRGRIRTRTGRGPGARRTRSGRHMPYACWHVFRDVVRATLDAYPGVVISTTHARYDAATFEATYPATGRINVGSMVEPVSLPQLCDCDDAERPGPTMMVAIRRTPTVADWRATVIVTRMGREIRMAPPKPPPEVRRIDAALAIKPGQCGWCGTDTMGDMAVWCCQDCQEAWQEMYPLSPSA